MSPLLFSTTCLSLLFLPLTACTGQGTVPMALPAENRAPETVVSCQASDTDTDGDELSDDCELALARTFAPLLVVVPEGCNWDTSVAPARLGGEYIFVAQTMAPDGVRIAYLPAYYRDCGWRGIKCLLPFVDCAPHDGDSEVIMVDVSRGANDRTWRVEGVFLSAHCFGSGADCRWYRGPELRRFEWAGAASVVWVAEGRQANYPSRNACDAGHSSIDTCDRNRARYRFPIVSQLQNIGSRALPRGEAGGCLAAADIGSASAVPVSGVVECFWNADAPFGGWQSRDGRVGATPYARYLVEVGGF